MHLKLYWLFTGNMNISKMKSVFYSLRSLERVETKKLKSEDENVKFWNARTVSFRFLGTSEQYKKKILESTMKILK